MRSLKEHSLLATAVIAAIAVIAFLSFIVYHAFQGSRLESYLEEVDRIQFDANRYLDNYNAALSNFTSDPGTAAQVLPIFAEVELVMDNAVLELEAIEPPPEASAYHDNLTDLYDKSSRLSADLKQLADYFSARAVVIKTLSDNLSEYQASLSTAATEAEIIAAAASFREKTLEILENLRSLEVPLPVYSNSQLEKNLETLSQNLLTLQEAVEMKDVESLGTIVSNISGIFSRDWTADLAELDAAGLKIYQEQVDEIRQLQQEVIEQREALSVD